MPTENRSSNTEMVSVPRELTQMAADAIDDLLADGVSSISAATWVDVSQQLNAILAQPAEQHQGEPVADVQQWWADTPDGDSALVVRVADCADPGEVERLRLEIEQLRFSLEAHDHEAVQDDCVRTENRTLRSQLAEREALLRVQDELLEEAYQHDIGTQLKRRMRACHAALLSASAKPGESQHKLAMDAACGEIEALRAQLAALPEKLIAAIDREQERLSAEDYLMDSDDCIKVIREAVSASAEPSEPVERDELAASL